MAEKKKIILEFDAQTGQVTEKLDEVKTSINDTNQEVSNVGMSIDSLGGSLGGFAGKAKGAFRAGVKGAKAMILSMKTLRGAVISTGIGAIVIAVVSLIQAVSRLQGVQDKYKAATAALSAVFDVIMDTVAYLGENIIKLFEDPQKSLTDFGDMIKKNIMNRFEGMLELIPNLGKAITLLFSGEFSEAGKVATDALGKAFLGVEDLTEVISEGVDVVVEYAEGIADVAIQAYKLEIIEQRLEDLKIQQIKTQAQRNLQIAEARLLAEDETKSYEEREKALQQALDLEKANLAEKLANAITERNLIKQRNALSESSREDRRAEAEAEAKILDLQAESVTFQKRVFTTLQTLQREAQSSRDKALKEEADSYAELADARDEINKALNESNASAIEKEIMASEEKYSKLLDMADQYGLDRAEIEEAQNSAIKAIQDKYRQKDIDANKKANKKKFEDEKKLKDSRIAIAGEAVGAIIGLTEAFAKNGEKGARRQFKVAKALGIAEAIINTSRAIMAQLANPDPTAVVTGRNFVQAGIAGALGVAQVAKIARSKFGATASGGGSVNVPQGGGQSQAPQTQAPQIDFSFLQQGANQNSIQAYVLSSNVSNSAQANQLIQDQASL